MEWISDLFLTCDVNHLFIDAFKDVRFHIWERFQPDRSPFDFHDTIKVQYLIKYKTFGPAVNKISSGQTDIQTDRQTADRQTTTA